MLSIAALILAAPLWVEQWMLPVDVTLLQDASNGRYMGQGTVAQVCYPSPRPGEIYSGGPTHPLAWRWTPG